jgi:type VI secretion system protein ImpE
MSVEAKEFLSNNDLNGALEALQATIRADPSNPKHRIFLFQLLCVMGNWKRAITQLKVSAELDPLALMMAQTYREGIICEIYREKVFSGDKVPLIFGEPEEWLALLIESLKVLSTGAASEAHLLREKAFSKAPAVGGEINGQKFDWIADADMRLGPILEVVINGRYFWLPFSAINSITIEAPVDLRDYVWTPANINLINGGDVVGLIPSRYEGSTNDSDPLVLLAKSTEWSDVGAETFVGKGQRLFTTDFGDIALMDVRTIKMNHSIDESG